MKLSRISSLTRWWLAALIALLLAACGGTVAFGGGDFFDDVQPAAMRNAFVATLSGSQEVPSNPSLATGAAVAVIDPASRLMRVAVVPSGISTVEARIQESPGGSVGPVVFPLGEALARSDIWTTQAALTETQLNTLQNGNYYANVTSALFTAGEVRGQLVPQAGGATGIGNTVVFINPVTGAQEVPQTFTGANAVGILIVDRIARTLTAVVTTISMDGTEAQIREAVPGAPGPLVLALAQTSAGSGIWFTKATLTDLQLQSLLAGNYYFEVRSAAFPVGEVRGQIVQRQEDADFNDCLRPLGCDGFGFSGIGFGFGF